MEIVTDQNSDDFVIVSKLSLASEQKIPSKVAKVYQISDYIDRKIKDFVSPLRNPFEIFENPLNILILGDSEAKIESFHSPIFYTKYSLHFIGNPNQEVSIPHCIGISTAKEEHLGHLDNFRNENGGKSTLVFYIVDLNDEMTSHLALLHDLLSTHRWKVCFIFHGVSDEDSLTKMKKSWELSEAFPCSPNFLGTHDWRVWNCKTASVYCEICESKQQMTMFYDYGRCKKCGTSFNKTCLDGMEEIIQSLARSVDVEFITHLLDVQRVEIEEKMKKIRAVCDVFSTLDFEFVNFARFCKIIAKTVGCHDIQEVISKDTLSCMFKLYLNETKLRIPSCVWQILHLLKGSGLKSNIMWDSDRIFEEIETLVEWISTYE